MARSTSTVSVLIASASFAGIFAVSGTYITHPNIQSPGLNLAFEAFILTVAYAFICSIIATGLSTSATRIYIDLIDRNRGLLFSVRLVQLAIRCLIMAFSFGAYVILTPFSKGLAILLCATGGIVPILDNPMRRTNIIILTALLRSIGWKELWWRSRFSWITYFGTAYYGFIVVLIVLLLSIFNYPGHILVLISLINVPVLFFYLECRELLWFHRAN